VAQTPDALLNLIIWLPTVGAILVALMGQGLTAPRMLALGFSLITFLLSLALFASYGIGGAGMQFVTRTAFIPAINSSYSVGVDGISLPLIVLNALLSFLAVVISWNITLRPQLYFSLLLALETAVMGVFSAQDLFLFFLFWELELAPMYLLIGIWGGPRREYAAMKFIIYTITGSAFMLLGILGLYFLSGARTFDLAELGRSASTLNQVGASVGLAPLALQSILFILLFIGFAVKLPVFPFHTWLPDAHVEAPTPVSVLLAGVLLKMGGYGMIRICFALLPDAARQLAWLIAILAVINVLYGAMVAMVQTDLKKMIANSSVSHMGYVLLGLAAVNQIGLQGAVVQLVTHGTITGLLFMMVGVVYDRTHTREIPLMQGLAQRMPTTAALFVIAGLASLGLPLMSGFVAEFLVFIGSYQVWPIQTILAAFAIVLTAGYLLWMLQRVFFGPISERWTGLGDASPREVFATGTLVFFILLIGIVPNIIIDMISLSVTPLAARLAGGA
jgi:NADH-quinone oxidoreductase subunit M